MTMRVIVADDQPEVRSAIRLALEQEGVTVVAEPTDAWDLVAEARRTQPNLVLVDWELPGLGERRTLERSLKLDEVLAHIRAASPGVRVVAMSGRSGARAEAVACGADDFLSKVGPVRYLLALVR